MPVAASACNYTILKVEGAGLAPSLLNVPFTYRTVEYDGRQ